MYFFELWGHVVPSAKTIWFRFYPGIFIRGGGSSPKLRKSPPRSFAQHHKSSDCSDQTCCV